MRRAPILALVALAAAGVWLGRTPDAPRLDALVAERALPHTGDEDDPAPGDPLAPPGAAADGLPRPRSLRGTRVDGGLVVDAAGRFVPTIDARRLFDYFLTASGEVPDDLVPGRQSA